MMQTYVTVSSSRAVEGYYHVLIYLHAFTSTEIGRDTFIQTVCMYILLALMYV